MEWCGWQGRGTIRAIRHAGRMRKLAELARIRLALSVVPVAVPKPVRFASACAEVERDQLDWLGWWWWRVEWRQRREGVLRARWSVGGRRRVVWIRRGRRDEWRIAWKSVRIWQQRLRPCRERHSGRSSRWRLRPRRWLRRWRVGA